MLGTTNFNIDEVRKRAAEIRGNWTLSERRRRKGLPPDTPAKLRDIILGPRGRWTTTSRK